MEAERLFIERQLATEETLAKALERDLELAEEELKVSQGQAVDSDGWGRFWTGVAELAVDKVEKISAEVDYVHVRQRARKVELGLGQSQVEFRDRRISELGGELEAISGFDSLAQAVWKTVFQWMIREAWKVFLVLLLLYFGVRFARRLLDRGVKVILKRADDNPDVDDDGDQRRQTLADVFLSVARIAIYIVTGLVPWNGRGEYRADFRLCGDFRFGYLFRLSNLVRDVVNGFFILLENQYAVGDVVTLNGQTGTVEKINSLHLDSPMDGPAPCGPEWFDIDGFQPYAGLGCRRLRCGRGVRL